MAIMICLLGLPEVHARQSDQEAITLAGQVPLVRLVDLCAERLGYVIEYDDKLLENQTATIRGTDGLSDQALWALTNQLLASHGFTTVSVGIAEPSQQPQLSVVKLSEAPNMARIEPTDELDQSVAGYVMTIQPLQHLEAKKAVELIKPLLSTTGGVVQELDQRRLLLGDLKPRVLQHQRLLKDLDLEGTRGVVEVIAAVHTPAVPLAASVAAAAAAQNSIAPGTLTGKLLPGTDGANVILVAPPRELAAWKELLAQFDQQEGVETRSYLVPAFDLREVAGLVEQTARQSPPRGSGPRWQVVQDELTGMLIVTATPSEHESIRHLLDRLALVPAQDRRPVRSFPIRNRNVTEIIEVLSSLLEAGVFEAGAFETNIDSNDPANHQRDMRSDSGATPIATSTSVPPTSVATTEPDRAKSGSPSPPTPTSPHPSASGRRTNGTESSLAGPPLMLTADVGTNTLIAVGEPRMLAQIEELLKTLDVRQPQVMVEVLVVSLNESDTRDLGIELEKIELSGDTVIRLTSLFGLGTPGLANPDQPLRGSGFSGLVLNPGDFRILIRALQTMNNGRALNIPKVLVNNNQQATLDAVLQQPFVSTNASDTVATTSFGGFENAGTTVTVRPQIARGDHLVVEYAVMLSAFVGDSSDPGIPPPRQQNKLQSVVTIPDGYTVALGGIEVRSEGDSVSQIPLVGDIPYIGELFKSRSKSESVSKFFVFIRPSVMRHESFEDLKFLSDDQWKATELNAAELGGLWGEGWPEVKPQVIR